MGAFCSLFGSEFEAQKTPLSHGFRGLAAIESIANQQAAAAGRNSGRDRVRLKRPTKPDSSRQDWPAARWLVNTKPKQTRFSRHGRLQRNGLQTSSRQLFDATRPAGWPATGFGVLSKNNAARFANGLGGGVGNSRPGFAAKAGANSSPRKRLHRTV